MAALRHRANAVFAPIAYRPITLEYVKSPQKLAGESVIIDDFETKAGKRKWARNLEGCGLANGIWESTVSDFFPSALKDQAESEYSA